MIVFESWPSLVALCMAVFAAGWGGCYILEICKHAVKDPFEIEPTDEPEV